jgi:hypothetical protein
MKSQNLDNNRSNDNFTRPKLQIINYLFQKLPQLFLDNLQKLIKIGPIKNYKMPWWVEIKTAEPFCIYYFGPFDSIREAKLNENGYIEDLVEEKADGITVELKQCLPDNLTVFVEA